MLAVLCKCIINTTLPSADWTDSESCLLVLRLVCSGLSVALAPQFNLDACDYSTDTTECFLRNTTLLSFTARNACC
eukprot:m.279448 g.279448  ORF g.279448 m.279448 type:complete len:76 (-) comp122887_c0_seq1:65-292(-)